MKVRCVICDIDNVYMDSREWEKHIPENKKDREGWTALLQYIGKCIPNTFIIQIINILATKYPILFITSREGTSMLRNLTIEQIEKFSGGVIKLNDISKHKLLMRKCNDFREPSQVKEEILIKNVLPFYSPMMAFEDDKDNVDMYKRNGIDTIYYTEFVE